MTNQPIEEKWKGGWQWRSDRMGLDKDQHDEIFDFIEKLLEQERQRMSNEVEELSWLYNDLGVSEFEENVGYVGVGEVMAIINK